MTDYRNDWAREYDTAGTPYRVLAADPERPQLEECHFCGEWVPEMCEEGSADVGESICHRCARQLRDDCHQPINICKHLY